MRAGVDTGGTFTDAVFADGTVVKVPSRPDDPASAVGAALAAHTAAGGAVVDDLAHGTTVATNALLEGTLAPVCLVTNAGLEDVIEIARQDRPSLYDPWVDRPPPLVPRPWRLGMAGRLGPDGREEEPLGPVPAVPDGAAAVAVVFVHSDLDPTHEAAVAAELRSAGHDVSASHEVSPEFREYERTVTTVANAGLRPVCGPYLGRLAALGPRHVSVLSSAGGLLEVAEAGARPVALALSGPAAGVRAGAGIAAACGFAGAVSFDMGGTSTDVCLIVGGVPEPAPTRVVGGYPLRMPSLAVHTVGAGGGSIAAIDRGGALTVGPRSAGAVPGPACYGRGGTAATVTDADLVLGRIPADHPFPGIGTLDRDAAQVALDAAGVDAADVVAVVDAVMAQAVRVVSVEQGVDPADLVLVAFGGAGPLHACAIAEQLGMPAVLVPPRAGALSAVGLLCAPHQRDIVRSWPTPLDHRGLEGALDALAAGLRALGGDPEVTTALDCRYAGQGHELTVGSVAAFPDEHLRRNGFRRDGTPVEVVALRARAVWPAPLALADLPTPDRRGALGPAVLAEADATTWVPAGWVATVGPLGTLVLRRA